MKKTITCLTPENDDEAAVYFMEQGISFGDWLQTVESASNWAREFLRKSDLAFTTAVGSWQTQARNHLGAFQSSSLLKNPKSKDLTQRREGRERSDRHGWRKVGNAGAVAEMRKSGLCAKIFLYHLSVFQQAARQ